MRFLPALSTNAPPTRTSAGPEGSKDAQLGPRKRTQIVLPYVAGVSNVVGRTRTLDSHASRLRRRLAEATDTPLVLNIWGVGQGLVLGGGKWSELAFLQRFGAVLRMAAGRISDSFRH
jgi:hypothetical protein